jgi:hypothetical protein
MNNSTTIDKSIDPLETLSNTVIGIATSDGLTIRGRLINFDERVIWLQKMSDDLIMVKRADIERLWRSRDCRRGGSQ